MSVRPFPSNNTLVVTQPPARVIKIVTAGPQGPPGPSGATTGSNVFNGDQIINGFISASYYEGDGSRLTNLPSTTNWNKDKEYILRNTEQLTFSGDYILEDCNLLIEGQELNSIGQWATRSFNGDTTGTINLIGDNGYSIQGPISEGGTYGLQIERFFTTATTMSVEYMWNGEDVGEDRPYYDVGIYEPTEPNFESRLFDINSVSESGSWTINVPANNWLTIGIWSTNTNSNSGSLQLTLPYIVKEDIQYSPFKSFKQEGTIFIGGNLLVKDSYIENNGKISVGGEVILIGDSQIVGTGTII